MAPPKNASEPKSRRSKTSQSQQQSKSTSLSSLSSLAAGSRTLDQQRDFDPRIFYAGTAAYTQHGVTETFDPASQQRSANNPFAYATTLAHHDLQSPESQAFGQSSAQSNPRTLRTDDVLLICPYHRSLLQHPRANARIGQELAPMDRYVADGPAERYAILHRPITGEVFTPSGCRCLELMQRSGSSSDGHAKK